MHSKRGAARFCLLRLLGAALLLQSELWSDETISLTGVAVRAITHWAVAIPLGGSHCPFCLLPTENEFEFEVFILICLDEDTELGKVGAQFAELERRTFAGLLVKANGKAEASLLVQ